MYYNSLGEKVSRARFKEMYNAFKNRQELIKAGLMNRRSLLKLGLLSGTGYLAAKNGLSAWAWGGGTYNGGQCASPPTTPFTLQAPHHAGQAADRLVLALPGAADQSEDHHQSRDRAPL